MTLCARCGRWFWARRVGERLCDACKHRPPAPDEFPPKPVDL